MEETQVVVDVAARDAWWEANKHKHEKNNPSSVHDPVNGGFYPAGCMLIAPSSPPKPTGRQRLAAALADLERAQVSDTSAALVPILAGVIQVHHEASWQAGREGRTVSPMSRRELGEQAVGLASERRSDTYELLRPLAEVSTDPSKIEQAIVIVSDEYHATGSRSTISRLQEWDKAYPGPNPTPHVSDLRPNLHNHHEVEHKLRSRLANLGRLQTIHERMADHLRKGWPTLVEVAGGLQSMAHLVVGSRKLRRVWADPGQAKELADAEASLNAVKLDLEAVSGAEGVAPFTATLKRQQTALAKQVADLRSGIEGRALAYVQAVLKASAEGDLKSWNLFMTEVVGAPGVFPQAVRDVVSEIDPIRKFGASLLVEYAYDSIPELEHIDA